MLAEALQQRLDALLPVGSDPDEYDAWVAAQLAAGLPTESEWQQLSVAGGGGRKGVWEACWTML